MKHDLTPSCVTPSALQRILLSTDGTVGEILQAFTGESIGVRKLSEEMGPSEVAELSLGTEANHHVLKRNVLLTGRQSGTTLVYAESLLRVERLDPALLDDLLSTDISIGQLLRSRRQETFREIIAQGVEEAGDCAVHFAIEPWELLLWRTYRIITESEPMMLITEKFPADGALSQPVSPLGQSTSRLVS